MRYFDAYRALFASGNWGMNLLMMSLCALIPAVGPIVLVGYLFEMIEYKHRHGGEAHYPDFDFNRFVDYLLRGLWPFLVQLVVSLVCLPLIYLVLFGPVICGALMGMPEVLLVLAWLGAIVVGVLLGLLMSYIMTPITLRAGLQQDFAAAFNVAFVKDFIGRMWLEMILVQLFMMVSGVVCQAVGIAMCCIGLIPMMAVFSFAMYHLQWQLYELYLQRGGTPIPMKSPPASPPGETPLR